MSRKSKILKTIAIVLAILLAILLVVAALGWRSVGRWAFEFQEDADKARLEHLLYWSALIEEYQSRTGSFPFQSQAIQDDQLVLVQILSHKQQPYFDPENPKFREDLYRSGVRRFSTQKFVAELEKGLGRTIDEYYDVQFVPTSFPVGPHYFISERGYVIWVPCPTCGITKYASTKLMYADFVPTVNIVSEGVASPKSKLLLRESMIDDPDFQRWMARPYHKEGFVRDREEQFLRDSKDR